MHCSDRVGAPGAVAPDTRAAIERVLKGYGQALMLGDMAEALARYPGMPGVRQEQIGGFFATGGRYSVRWKVTDLRVNGNRAEAQLSGSTTEIHAGVFGSTRVVNEQSSSSVAAILGADPDRAVAPESAMSRALRFRAFVPNLHSLVPPPRAALRFAATPLQVAWSPESHRVTVHDLGDAQEAAAGTAVAALVSMPGVLGHSSRGALAMPTFTPRTRGGSRA